MDIKVAWLLVRASLSGQATERKVIFEAFVCFYYYSYYFFLSWFSRETNRGLSGILGRCGYLLAVQPVMVDYRLMMWQNMFGSFFLVGRICLVLLAIICTIGSLFLLHANYLWIYGICLQCIGIGRTKKCDKQWVFFFFCISHNITHKSCRCLWYYLRSFFFWWNTIWGVVSQLMV